MTRVPCRACQKRRKLMEAKLLAKKSKGKHVQAAAIGAVLDVTGLVGRLMGEHHVAAEAGSGEDGVPPSDTGSGEGDRNAARPELDDHARRTD